MKYMKQNSFIYLRGLKHVAFTVGIVVKCRKKFLTFLMN